MARRLEVLAGSLLVVVASITFIESLGYPPSLTPGSPGPALFARVVSMLLAAVGVAIAVRRDVAMSHETVAWARVTAAITAIAVLVAVMAVADFFILLPLFLAAIMWLMGERGWRTLALVPLGFDVFVYLVFYRVFDVRLPTVLF